MLRFHILFSGPIVFATIINLVVIVDDLHVNTNSNNYKASRDFFSISLATTALAQTTSSDNNNNNTQQWIDKENNAKIIFAYDPASPVIGKPTKLLFAVQNLLTGNEMKEELHARIIITNGRDILKITNSTFPDGNFSINYTFPDSGSYQVIPKIDSRNYSELASFNVFVPSQASSSTYKSFVSLMLYYVIPITSSAAGITIYLYHRKKI
jgi:hypothetical protein